MDDEKYFKLTGNNVVGNRYFCSTDPVTAFSKLELQWKTKSGPKIMIWVAVSSESTYDICSQK